ncbi:MAG: UxaA family hydrolase [Pirellulaceae bacterium]
MLPESAVLVLHEDDDVCVAIQPLSKGNTFTGSIGRIVVVEPVRLGHKIAQRGIAKGESVLKYGQIIGVALERIEAGSLPWRRGVCALDDRTHSLEGSTAAVYKIWSAVTCHRFSSDP